MSEQVGTPNATPPDYKRLRTTGTINIVLGTLSLIASLSQVSTNSIYIIPILISAYTIAASLRAVFSPIHRTFGAFGIMFLVAGAWHLVAAFTRPAGVTAIVIGALGVFQVLWSLQWFDQWRKGKAVS